MRERTTDNSILKYSFNAQMPTVVFQAKDMPGGGAGGDRGERGERGGGGAGKKLGRREAEREARLRRRAEARGGVSNAANSNSNSNSNGYSSDFEFGSNGSWSFEEEDGEGAASGNGGTGAGAGAGASRSSSFVRSPMAQQVIQAQMAAAAEMGDFAGSVGAGVGPAPDDRDELSCRKAWKLRQRQAAAGVYAEDEGGEEGEEAGRGGGDGASLLRLFPFDLDPDRMWEVLLAMGLVDKVRGKGMWEGRGGKCRGEQGGKGEGRG